MNHVGMKSIISEFKLATCIILGLPKTFIISATSSVADHQIINLTQRC